jgi:hypothetical protein
MADIFLSYAAEDSQRVRPLIAGLEDRGFSVWWDRKIPPGKSYSRIIKENFDAASAVLVIWSQHSVESEWVHIEAKKAKDRGVLVPALIDLVADDIPWEFSLVQAANLVRWETNVAHDGFDELIQSLREHVGARTSHSEHSSNRREDDAEHRARTTPAPAASPHAPVAPSHSSPQPTPREQFVSQLKQRGWRRGDPYMNESSPNIYYADNHPHKKPRIVLREPRVRVEKRPTKDVEYALWKSFSLQRESEEALAAIDALGRNGPTEPPFYYYGASPDA